MDALGARRPLMPQLRASRVARWLFQDRGPEHELELHHRRIFVLPTRSGLTFGAMLAALLIASMNYQLSLGYLLTFVIAACAWVGVHLTFANLAHLRLRSIRCAPVFAGEIAAFEVELDDARGRDRYAIHVRSDVRDVLVHIAGRSTRRIAIERRTERRGWLDAPRATIVTTFPFGIWRGWSYWQPALRCLVYPAPEPNAPPLPAALVGHEDGAGGSGDDSVGALRPYAVGDPSRLLAWKAYARSGGQTLATKLLEGSATRELWLDARLVPAGLGIEARLSRLTAWVLAAHAAQIDYGLRLAPHEIAPARGEAHREACLEALALARLTA